MEELTIYAMDVREARNLLGEKYDTIPDEEIQKLIDMVKCLCSLITEDYLKERKKM